MKKTFLVLFCLTLVPTLSSFSVAPPAVAAAGFLSPTPNPRLPGRPFPARPGSAIAWLAAGPALGLGLATPAELPRLLLRGESEHFGPDSPRALTPPTTIRVAHHPANSCRDLPDWTVTVIPFEEYVARVLPAEVYTSWPAATLQAQAIAARTFAWRQVLLAPPGAAYDITDWAVDQVMCDKRYESTDAATAATAGRYLSYGGTVILAQYSAENGSPTLDGGLPYLRSVMDPVSLGRARRGHGHGLSQWGAYRWAAWHGWNPVQILAHYYTAAQVVDPAGADLHLSLLTPWPGTWLTGSNAYLTAHASGEAVSALTFQAPGLTAQDSTPQDGWTATWPLPEELARPVIIAASTGAITHTLSLAGEDRLPPAGELSLPASTADLTVTLHLSATDPGASGLAGVAVGGDWQVRAADFGRVMGGGSLGADPDALSGAALTLPTGTASRWEALLPLALATDRIYQAYARVRTAVGQAPGPSEVPGAWLASSLSIARVELYDPAANVLLGFADLRPGDFRQTGLYQEFPIDFWLAPEASGRLGVRVIAAGEAEIGLDRVRVLSAPQPFQTAMPYGLARYAGPQTVVVKLLDGAGNPSADLIGTTELADVTPPANWQLIAPTGWVSTTLRPPVVTRVEDDLSGIAPESAAARITTDAGVSWTAWQSVGAAIGPGLQAELTLTWPGGEGSSANRVQFRAADLTGWSSLSPAWPVRVDVTPPTVYGGLSPAANAAGWITAPVTLTLWAEDLVSGVAGIWHRCVEGPRRELSGSQTAGEGATALGRSSLSCVGLWQPYVEPLRFQGEGLFRVRYRAGDRAGLSSEEREIAWQLDTVPPTATLVAPRRATPDAPVPVAWSGQDGIGIAAFDVQVSFNLGPWKDWLRETAATEAEYPPLPFGTLQLRVRARDLAGNVGAWSASQPVTVARAFQFLPLVSTAHFGFAHRQSGRQRDDRGRDHRGVSRSGAGRHSAGSALRGLGCRGHGPYPRRSSHVKFLLILILVSDDVIALDPPACP